MVILELDNRFRWIQVSELIESRLCVEKPGKVSWRNFLQETLKKLRESNERVKGSEAALQIKVRFDLCERTADVI